MNIVLDIGNVICRWQPAELVASVFPEGVEQQAALRAVVEQEDWLDLDRGVLELDLAVDRAAARSGLPRDLLAAVYEAVPRHLAPVPAMVAAIEQLAVAGAPLYVLSNMHRHAWAGLQRDHDFWDHFQGALVSCEVGFIKPERAIYAALCEQFSLQPAATVFLDDMPENVAAARDFGLRAEQVVDIDAGAAQLLSVAAELGYRQHL